MLKAHDVLSKMYTYEEILEWPVSLLKSYLAVRGLNVGGRRMELVARAFAAMEMSLPIIQSETQQKETLRKQYLLKLESNGIIDPYAVDTTNRINDLTKWPNIDSGSIFSYILKKREFDADYIGKYKDQKAYSYFDSGFVGLVSTFEYKHGFIFLYANVRSSMSIHEEKEVWIAIKSITSPIVVTAHCTCMAGASECCNHVIATL